jgi:SulP family sulfate permease
LIWNIAYTPGALKRDWHIAYTADALKRDALAGLTVTVISVPQAMAYALLAGVDPQYGLYSAIVVTFVASVFGSSSHLINGPTAAISLVVFTALSHFDPDQRIEATQAMFLLAVMVGSIQVLIGVLRLGDLTRYISESVILGFMFAASIQLALGQVANAFGVRNKGTGDQHLFYRLWLTLTEGDPISSKALVVTAGTLVLALVLRLVVRRYKLPQFDMFASLLIVAAVAFLLGWTVPGADGRAILRVAGAVPSSLASFCIPDIKLSWIPEFASDALAIAFLGLLEALAIAKSIANQTKQPLDFNRQCLAEGLANFTGGFFQCLPGSGSLSRSAINVQAGAVTRFSGIVAAGIVASAVLVFAPLSRYVPTAALAALLILTAVRLFDLRRIRYTVRAAWVDAGAFLVTAISGLAFGLDFAILIGVVVSILLFVPRAAKLKASELILDDHNVVRERLATDCSNDGFLIYDLEGELFFGAAPELHRYLTLVEQEARARKIEHVLLRLKRVRHPDVVSLEIFEHFLRQSEAGCVTVWLSGLQRDLLQAFDRLGFRDWFPSDRLFPSRQDDENSSTIEAVKRIRRELRARAGSLDQPVALTYQA